jgi:hypothetical protein
MWIAFGVYTIHFCFLKGFMPIPRYIFVAVILVGMIGAWAYVNAPAGILRRVTTWALILWGIFMTAATTYKKLPSFPAAFGFESRLHYIENTSHGFPWIKDIVYLNDHINKSSRVLVFDPRTYYLDADYVLASHLISILQFDGNYSSDGLLQWLKENNVGYVWVIQKKENTDPYNWPLMHFVQQLIDEGRMIQLYENTEKYSAIYKVIGTTILMGANAGDKM